MPNIKNLELITAKVKEFAVSDLKFITELRYWVEIDTVKLYDPYNIPMLLISFVLIPGGESPTYKVTIRFKKVSSLHLASGGAVVQLSWFEILDISGRGWETDRYCVRDIENEDRFKFYCNDIEVTGIEEVEWIMN